MEGKTGGRLWGGEEDRYPDYDVANGTEEGALV